MDFSGKLRHKGVDFFREEAGFCIWMGLNHGKTGEQPLLSTGSSSPQGKNMKFYGGHTPISKETSMANLHVAILGVLLDESWASETRSYLMSSPESQAT